MAASERASLDAAIVARRYYLDGQQKSEIADDLGISRFKVARLLDDARASGLVRITVALPAELDVAAGDALAALFGLRRALVVRVSDTTPAATIPLLGSATANYLTGRINADDVLGISWGATLSAVVDAVPALPAADLVQIVGSLGANTADSTTMDRTSVELIRRLARTSGGRAFPLYAPLLVGSSATAQALRRDPSLARTTQRFAELTVALVGIGGWPESILAQELVPAERGRLIKAGAAAEVCTFVLDESGTPMKSAPLARSVGISWAELRAVPEVIGVAGGLGKARAIAAAARSGLISTLVTDSITARQLLENGSAA